MYAAARMHGTHIALQKLACFMRQRVIEVNTLIAFSALPFM